MERKQYEILDGYPYPIIWRKRGEMVTDPCPFCGEVHSHSIGEGLRAVHCKKDRLTDVVYDGIIMSFKRGYVIREY